MAGRQIHLRTQDISIPHLDGNIASDKDREEAEKKQGWLHGLWMLEMVNVLLFERTKCIVAILALTNRSSLFFSLLATDHLMTSPSLFSERYSSESTARHACSGPQ